MKHIIKQGAPRDYLDWCKANKGLANEDYRCLQNPEKASLQEALINEQGGICAYTMRRITSNSSHIEHIKPESKCREDDKKDGKRGSDLDYSNMVACFPFEGMKADYRYGAQKKGGWWEDEGKDFVSPLHTHCEEKFTFNIKGEIYPTGGDTQAQTTINVLELDHESLTEDRKRAIAEFILGPNGDDPLSPKKAEQAIQTICELNKSAQYREFCVAIRHSLVEYIRNLERAAKRRKFTKSQQKKKN